MSSYRAAVVTGASSGIGRALALQLARSGVAALVVVARRRELLDDLAREIRALERRAYVECIDLSDTELTVARLRALDRELRFDLVVSNAGLGAPSGANPLAWETLRGPFHVNFCGAAATLTAVLPDMVERRRGHLVGIGSLSAYGALPNAAAYCTPKAGLGMLLDCLRMDLQGTDVHVTHVRLGFVRTAMVAHSTHPMPQMLEAEAVAQRIVERLPRAPREIVLPRALGMATRVAGALPGSLRELAARFVRER
ncbi:MAG: SDR family NAD(P)-dependent oxidoreductase [Polyangiaceae bacterium]|nr:SDR family NAD(P)-dependent oxidoreductase [Polyangiaceae bacterium]